MADSKPMQVADAICATLMETGRLKSADLAQATLPPLPGAELWWPGFSNPSALTSKPLPKLVNHSYDVAIMVPLLPDTRQSQRDLADLVEVCLRALHADSQLRGTVVKSGVTGGQVTQDADRNQPALVCTLTVQVEFRWEVLP